MVAHPRKLLVRTIAFHVFALFFFSSWLTAQTGTSAISGRVTDPSGGLVQDAVVTVTDEATGVKTELHSNAQGIYSAEALGVGSFTIRVDKAGFSQSVTSHVHVDPGERRTADVMLKLGAETATVTVSADALQVNTPT
jgi:hypothetical protein